MKIYISGRITGLVIEEATELFEKAENDLRAKGYDVVNPMTLIHNHDKSWQSYMKEDIKALCDCDAIYMLLEWGFSKGAEIEHRLALDLGMIVLYEKNFKQ